MIIRLLKALIVILLITGIVLLIRLATPAESKDTLETPVPSVNSSVLHNKVNSWRKTNNLSELPEEESLCKYAQDRATQIKIAWSHDLFWQDSCSKVNYSTCGENLSMGYFSEDQTLTAWLNSPTHKDNLQKNWSSMCIRCQDGYCAQEFGI